KSDAILGTPRYFAPEQIRAPSSVGPPADLYALGAVLYAMLAGRPPFSGKMAEVIHDHLENPPPPLAEHGGLEAVAMRLLEKKPEDRYPNAGAVVAAIDQIARDMTAIVD